MHLSDFWQSSAMYLWGTAVFYVCFRIESHVGDDESTGEAARFSTVPPHLRITNAQLQPHLPNYFQRSQTKPQATSPVINSTNPRGHEANSTKPPATNPPIELRQPTDLPT